MKALLIVLLTLPLLSLACDKHDSYKAWFGKGLIKVEKDGALSCDVKKLGEKNCTDAMPYIYHKLKHKK